MSDECKEEVGRKKVTFAAEVSEPGRSMLFSHPSTKSKKISSKTILSLLKRNQLDTLRTYLQDIDPTEITNFFCSEKGQVIISYLFSRGSNDQFYFVLRNTPADCLKNAICQNGHALLVNYLTRHQLAEQYNADSAEIRAMRIEKFKFLAELGEDIGHFMATAASNREPYMTDRIMDDFRVALSHHASLRYS